MDLSWTVADYLYYLAWASWILALPAFILGLIRVHKYQPDDSKYARYEIEKMAEEAREKGMPRIEHWMRYGKGFFAKATFILFFDGVALWFASCMVWGHQNENLWSNTNLVGYSTSQEVETQEWRNTCMPGSTPTTAASCNAEWLTVRQSEVVQTVNVDRKALKENLHYTGDTSPTERQSVDTAYLLVFQDSSGELYQVKVDKVDWELAELGQSPLDFVNENFGEVKLPPYTGTGDSSPVLILIHA